jgi:hypothetical protein
MNTKSATTLLAVSILVASDIAQQIESLPPREHIHPDRHTAPVTTAGTYTTGSGRMLRPVLRKTEGDVVGETFMYETDLPFAVTVQILDHVNRGSDGHLCRCWQIRRITLGVCGPWTGKFTSAQEAALAA